MRSQCTSMIEDFNTPWSSKTEKDMSRFEKKTWKIKVEVKRRGKDKRKEGGKKKEVKIVLYESVKLKMLLKMKEMHLEYLL